MNETLIEVRDLTVAASAPGGQVLLLDDIGFRLRCTEVVGVVGESGSGKTTLTRSIAGFLDKNCQVLSGEIEYRGQPLSTRAERGNVALGASDIGLVLQSPMASLNPVLRLEFQMKEVLRAGGQCSGSRDRDRARMRTALEEMGFADPRDVLRRYPHQLSGGMAQRAAIALAMLCEPAVLIGDECTSALDVASQAVIARHLRRIAREHEAGVLLVTHDLALAAEICDRLVVMSKGRVVESGALEDVLGHPEHPYTRSLISAVPSAIGAR